MHSALRVIAAAAMVVSALGAAEHCDDSYECKYFFQTSKDLYYWDFSPLCNADEYVHQDFNLALNDTFHFNICGMAQANCRPSGWSNPYQAGVAVQMWGETPKCRSNADKTCTDNTQDPPVPACCTSSCEVIGQGNPIFQLQDQSNPASGGIVISHTAVPPDDMDPNLCPWDASLGGYRARSVNYVVSCGKSEALTVTRAYEDPQCVYNLEMTTSHACGQVYSGVDSGKAQKKKDAGAIAGAYFGGIATVLVIGGAAYWYFFVYTGAGYSGFGSKAASGFATGSSSAAVGSSSGYSAVGQ